MERFDIEKIYHLFKLSNGISTDTRTIQKGQLFFALKGENFNGNLYAKKALDTGAAYVIVDEDIAFNDSRIVRVENSLVCLQELAKHHRKQLSIPIIAITGSNGKTTTKELLAAVLSQQYNTFATKGNLNNHIGVPLSLLSINEQHEMAIIEMGANHQKEISDYCQWAIPDYGLINNIGKAHLEGFGGIEGVIKGKSELYDAIAENDGTIFYNSDDSILIKQSKKVTKRIAYAQNNKADYNYHLTEENENVHIHCQGVNIPSQLSGMFNGLNMAAALVIGLHFGVSIEKIKDGISRYKPSNNRSQVIKWRTNKVLLDAYNANPSSMQLAITSFAKSTQENKIAWLGDMFEIGEDSLVEHQSIIEYCKALNLEKVVFCGEAFYACRNSDFTFFATTLEMKKWVEENPPTHSYILIKGSRGMKMESLIEH